MKLISSILIVSIMILSCNPPKTVYISNKTDSPLSLLVDSSYQSAHPVDFKDSINGLRVEKKKVLDFGEGKWTKEDKKSLEELIKHTRIIRDGSTTAVEMPAQTEVSLISFNVEELWLNIK
ncbi:hypothetical protein [Dyadobacter fermentans]|nr:hypothetical protein [Dyadobacter fermentans]